MEKKILFLIEDLSGGGAERSVLTLLESLMNKGHSTRLLTLYAQQDYTLSSRLSAHTLDITTHSPEASKIFQHWLKQEEAANGAYDLIVSNLSLKATRDLFHNIHRNTIYFCVHNHTSIRELMGKPWWRKKSILQYARSVLDGRNIIPVSQGVADDLVNTIKVKPRSVNIIHNGFDIPGIQKLAREKTALPFSDYIIHVGSLKEQKNHERLLKAYVKSGISLPLVLLGKGSNSRLKKIKKLIQKLNIQNKVYFAGFHENSYPWIANARMLVLSSDCEGFGRVIVEALICGTPVVSTDCPSGPSEILTGSLEGCLTKLNAESLAITMKAVYQNPPAITAEHINRWSIDTMSEKYLSLTH